MAKKKMNHPQEKETHQDESAMDEITEKLESLKSLNAMLLKETVERRQQVDSLVQTKGSLESELTRSNSEKEALKSELSRLSDGFVGLEVEKNVMVVFVAQQAEVIERERAEIERKMKGVEGDMGKILRQRNELEKIKSEKETEVELLNEKLKKLGLEMEKDRDFTNGVCLERDEMKAKLDIQINETNTLERKLVEIEKSERFAREEVENSRAECNLVVNEKKEMDKKVESLMRDKESLEKSLVEANEALERMGSEIEGIEEKNKEQTSKRNELEKVVSGLHEMVDSLRKQEERFKLTVVDLEEKCADSEDREREMRRQIDELVKEKDEGERKLLKILEEKSVAEKDLAEASKHLDELKLKMDEVVNEKSMIAEAKVKTESEVGELVKEVAELRKDLTGLEDCCRDQKGEILGLESEVRSYRDSLERVSVERDEAMKGIEEQKQNVVGLLAKIKVLENNVEENSILVEKMKTESARIRDEKEDLESRCSLLKEEIASAENELAEAQKELHAMKLKVETTGTDLGQIMKVLRSTAMLVCLKDDSNATISDVGAVEESNGEVEPCVAELEAIKNAFKRRENALDDMKRQLAVLENSVAEAHKKKSFWTVISSATTICAAISLAYVARGH